MIPLCHGWADCIAASKTDKALEFASRHFKLEINKLLDEYRDVDPDLPDHGQRIFDLKRVERIVDENVFNRLKRMWLES